MIPVVADEHVDPAFGTGAVKVTPAHDPNDFEIGRRHDLPMPTIMDERGVITGHRHPVRRAWTGSRRASPSARRCARRAGSSRRSGPTCTAVGHCSRCGTSRRAAAVAAVVRQGRPAGEGRRRRRARRPDVTIHPTELEPRYFAWVDNMHDWCISRQLWWGHRIPVWYGPDGEVVCVGPDEEPPGEAGRQDDDVLDTWFSSGLWPFSTLGWPDETADLRALLPDVRAAHRLRHPLLLGRPDDDVRALRDGRRAARSTRSCSPA